MAHRSDERSAEYFGHERDIELLERFQNLLYPECSASEASNFPG